MGRRAFEIGTIRVVNRGRPIRLIRCLTAAGDPVWKTYARHVFETHHGPIPCGKRVLHEDGDSLNDAPGNLILGDAADSLFLALEDPRVDARRRRRAATSIARCKAEISDLRRAFSIIPWLWYLTIPARQFVYPVPFGTAAELLEAWRISCPHRSLQHLRRRGVSPVRGRKVPVEGFARVTAAEAHIALTQLVPDLYVPVVNALPTA